ncbi:MAG: hypothetical protein FWF05_08470, partial [Oscillospiraceae bacterium]|nr:hypothetical protein [Oscillospiraceae bacterium]
MSKSDIGLRLGLEGERDFKSALRDINQSFKVLGSEMQLVTSQFDKNDRSIEAVTARNKVLNREIDEQKNKISTLQAALQNAASSFGENDTRTKNWQIQLNKAHAELNGMERELKTNDALLADFAKQSKAAGDAQEDVAASAKRAHASFSDLGGLLRDNVSKTVAEVKDGIADTARKVVDGAKEMGGSIVQFAKDTVTGENNVKALGDALREKLEARLRGTSGEADDAADSMEDLGGSVEDAGKEMDDAGKKTSVFGDVLKASLAADAIKAGLKAVADAVRAVSAAVKDFVGESMEKAGAFSQSQTLLTQVMQNTMDASDEEVASLVKLAEAQEKVGVVSKTAQVTALAELASFVERKDALEDMLPVMNDYVAYQYGATASEDQARNVATALGKAIQGNIDGLAKQGFTLSKNEKEWFKTASEAERTKFVMDMVSESMGGVNEALAQTDAGKMANLATVMDNTKIAVGTMANSFKAHILGQMLPSISSLSDAFLGVLHGEGSVEDMAAAFDGVFDQIVSMINDFLPLLVTIGSQLITAIAAGLSNNMDTIVAGALSVIDQLVGAIVELLPVILDAGTKLLFGLLDGIIKALPLLVEAAVQIVAGLAVGLGDALPQLIPAVVEAVTTIVNGLIDNLPLLMGAALQLILGLADGLLAALPELIAALPAIITGVVDFLIGAIPELIDAGLQLLTAIIGALPEIIAAIVEALPQIIDGVVGGLLGALPQLIEAGWQLLMGLLDGIFKAVPELLKGVGSVVKSLINSVLELFGIHSPSAVFADIGKNLLQGLWQGIENVKDWLIEKIKGLGGAITGAIKAVFGINSPSAVFRDQIGKNLALGLGEGFEAAMKNVSRDMYSAVPTDFEA